jgi:two-component system CheB/CheR fusion protein
MGELQLTNDDLHNILVGIADAIVIIGMDLRIRRYTQMAEKLLNLVPGDVGRSVSQLNAFIVGHRIEELAAKVIEKLTPIDERVRCADQRWYDLRVSPYRTLDHSIKGALIVLLAVDENAPTSDVGGAPAGDDPSDRLKTMAGAKLKRGR